MVVRHVRRRREDILDDSPDLAWLFIKGPAKMAEPALIDTFTKDEDLATKEFLTHHLKFTRVEVAGENPSPLERLLAERVVATWLEVQLFEGLCMAGMKSGTFKQDDHRQKRLDRAHRRLLSASARSPRSASSGWRCRST
jgi:hypothetical protein